MKIFAISDVHGRLVTLEDFKSKGFDPNNPDHHIVFNGDYFDRYTHNVEVYNFVTSLKSTLPDRVHLLLGNHDGFMKRFVDYVLEHSTKDKIAIEEDFLPHWYRNGGAITIKQFFNDILDRDTLDDKLKYQLECMQEFCNSLEDYYETPSHIFTHASIELDRSIDYWDRTPIIKENLLGKNLYLGHTTFEDVMEMYDGLELFESDVLTYVYNPKLNNHVYMIDNGEGNNIVVLDDISEKK